MKRDRTFLVLEDGTIFKGWGFGKQAPLASDLSKSQIGFNGEIVFNTAMSGYHEVLTDPSYTGQMVLMTYPHIGNYGDDDSWSERGPETGRNTLEIKCSALIIRSLYDGPIPEGRETLDSFMKRNEVCGITEIDTRGLTLKIRDEGACNGVLVTAADGQNISDTEKKAALAFIKQMPDMEGANFVKEVGTLEIKKYHVDNSRGHLALLDCGVKENIIREFNKIDVSVTLFPSTATEKEILDSKADALFLSNGPGDPGVLDQQIALGKAILGKMPILGICLGHQMLSQAIGAKTYKMKFGHHGSNQPVRDEKTGKVFVTSQNHGFAVDKDSLPEGVQVRFINANDNSVEGIEWPEKKLLCVQFHPEAAPGPHDSKWLFESFLEIGKGE